MILPVFVCVFLATLDICYGEAPAGKYLERMDEALNDKKKAEEDELNPSGMKEKYAELNAARDSQLFQDAVMDEDEDEYVADYNDQELDKNYTTD
jgi:hypothetical protein